MLDWKFIRENIEFVERKVRERGYSVPLKDFVKLYDKRSETKKELDELRHKLKENSRQVGRLKSQGKNEEADELMKKGRELSDEIQKLEKGLKAVEQRLLEISLIIPNLHDDDVPVGPDDTYNQEVRRWGKPREFDFEPKPHWEIGEKLGILDLKRAVKVAESGFSALKGAGAVLERALINFFLTENAKRGYIEVMTPFLINSNALKGTGQLPKFENDLYKVENEDLYLNPTAEVPIVNLLRDEIIPEEELTISLTGYAPSFRKEAGAYGAETRGIIRQHQFNKVEMIKITKPEWSAEEHEKMVSDAENLLQLLNLPYRVVLLSSGDMGFSASKCYDLEVWIPSQNRYREISSVSNTRDFQARRAKIRFKRKETKKNELVHTLNGSGLAVGRTVVAILENFQTPDGKVVIPEKLRPFTGFDIIEPQKGYFFVGKVK